MRDAWENIADRAKELGKSTFYCNIKDADLFAAEAQYNNLYLLHFHSTWHNHLRTRERAQKGKELNKKVMLELTNKAFQAVMNFIQKHVLTEKQVLRLSALCPIYINVFDTKDFQIISTVLRTGDMFAK